MFGVDGLFCRTRRPGTNWIPWKLHCDFLCQWLINESSNCWSFLPFVYWTHFRKMIFNHNKVLVYKVTKKPHEICAIELLYQQDVSNQKIWCRLNLYACDIMYYTSQNNFYKCFINLPIHTPGPSDIINGRHHIQSAKRQFNQWSISGTVTHIFFSRHLTSA